MDLSRLKLSVKNKRTRRKGRGTGSGRGKTGGRGHKGAGQHSAKRQPYSGYAGGNLPFLRRIPKRGFTSPVAKNVQVVTLRDINTKLKSEKEIDPKVLKEVNLIKDEKQPVKILATIKKDKFSVKAVIKADAFSKGAIKIIDEAGGKTECLKR